jgi:hypothetical protein
MEKIVCIFVTHKMMKHTFIPFLILLFLNTTILKAQSGEYVSINKEKTTIIYFNPEIVPEVDEIKQATFEAFFTSVSDYYSSINNSKMLRVQNLIQYDDVNKTDIIESCKNNDAKFAVVPKVKFFKVGFGKYILSSQVIVSLKLYDAKGDFLYEKSYDTFRKKARILGSAENSIKLGTKGVLKMMTKELHKIKNNNPVPL